MDRVEEAATPATAATVVVPDSVTPPGLVPIATVPFDVEPVTVLPNVSCIVTCSAGEIATPAVAVVGWTVNASFEAAAAVMLNADDAAPASAPDAAVRV